MEARPAPPGPHFPVPGVHRGDVELQPLLRQLNGAVQLPLVLVDELGAPRQHLGGAPRIVAEPADETRRAFIGVRPCDLAAIGVQAKVFETGPYTDVLFEAVRDFLKETINFLNPFEMNACKNFRFFFLL